MCQKLLSEQPCILEMVYQVMHWSVLLIIVWFYCCFSNMVRSQVWIWCEKLQIIHHVKLQCGQQYISVDAAASWWSHASTAHHRTTFSVPHTELWQDSSRLHNHTSHHLWSLLCIWYSLLFFWWVMQGSKHDQLKYGCIIGCRVKSINGHQQWQKIN